MSQAYDGAPLWCIPAVEHAHHCVLAAACFVPLRAAPPLTASGGASGHMHACMQRGIKCSKMQRGSTARWCWCTAAKRQRLHIPSSRACLPGRMLQVTCCNAMRPPPSLQHWARRFCIPDQAPSCSAQLEATLRSLLHKHLLPMIVAWLVVISIQSNHPIPCHASMKPCLGARTHACARGAGCSACVMHARQGPPR